MIETGDTEDQAGRLVNGIIGPVPVKHATALQFARAPFDHATDSREMFICHCHCVTNRRNGIIVRKTDVRHHNN
jgi:hypothetical protein